MKIEHRVTQVALVLACAILPAILANQEESHGKRVAKQIHTKATVVDSDDDHKAAETGFGAAGIGGHGKYFQDFYLFKSGPHEIEFGHVCENPDEWEQRFEKKDFKNNRHQGQARWGDKHGGYGEHYWDYNHAGHGHGDDGGDDGGEGGYSEPVPEYKPVHGKVTAKRQSPAPVPQSDASAVKTDERVKRQHQPSPAEAPRLVFDVATGQVIDEVTGQAFLLQPIQ
ncbi:uncharacterized protein [Anabrus simplex]|uniref:uncharacterized protein isoform X1 n=1 Tax=Anabrus simplex TaxID=316456 RepID=UPI0035A37E4E